ncbi:cell division protein FtsZ [Flavobacterium sp. MAH-1]|uniref:Cell division protein FtsZ n=1 Tax=Flavobacterium agri TaxID=2743471 RepID=A0A7Y8Y386_9FLAO|nr:cell division protein FtsZ [Flavobacterium agri]NUY81729.1 cell division protein FtsZ [Flavobacterium agri]NYA71753.1 cell division protein FtsZ [Flavobacterium agri]
MTGNSEFGSISFDLPKNQSNVIKVIGVGGGGSNAINHMFKQGIKGVDFVVCNTDSQALQNSSVPNKIQLGVNLTEGLGAGANPEVGQQSAIESVAEIEKVLDSNTKMVFITAGMGGGTGTGAAPVIAQLAKEKDILTVGIVTIPFQFEGKVRSEQAMQGVERLRKQVDSLIVINNNKLREVYGNLGFKAGFSKADEVLATASRGIAEVITHHYTQNIDLKDAKTVLSNSGTAIMGSAVAMGENRAKEGIVAALDSPLLNDNKIAGAKNVLLLIVSGTSEITIDEIGEINDYIQSEAGFNANIIMGVGEDETLGESIAVTIIATGFNMDQQTQIVNTEPKRIIHSLDGEQKMEHNLSKGNVLPSVDFLKVEESAPQNSVEDIVEKVVFELTEEEPEIVAAPVAQAESVVPSRPTFEMDLVPTSEFIKNLDVTFEVVSAVQDFDFFMTTPEVKEIKVQEPVFVQKEEQAAFSFDLPIASTPVVNEDKILFELTQETRDIKVNDPVQVVPMTELNETGIVKYSLEEYMEVEKSLMDSKPAANAPVVPAEPELDIQMKQVETNIPTSNFSSAYEEVSPLEMSIEETLKHRADERRRKLKEFNYKFHNARIDEFEKEPAYKRSGIDISSNPINNANSRMSLGTDSNDDLQLRSNNSFLHDNVD